MRKDTILAAGQWHDLYAATGIAPGTPLLITNKSISTIYLWEGPAVADMGMSDGEPCYVGDRAVISQAGITGAYVCGLQQVRVNVQEYTE